MKSRYAKSLANAALMALGILPQAAQAQLVDLGAATGYAINNAGQVALSTGIYGNGAVTPLPALPGDTTPVTPFAINASGQVAASGPSEYSGGHPDQTPAEFVQWPARCGRWPSHRDQFERHDRRLG